MAVFVAALLAVSLLALIDTGAADGAIRDLVQSKTHRTLSFGRLAFHLLQREPTIVVEDMRLGSPPNTVRDDLVHIGHGVLHVKLLPLLLGHVSLTGIELTGLDLRMVRLGPGRNNYSFGGAGLSPTLREVEHMTISPSTVSYTDPQRQLRLQGQIEYDSRRSAEPMRLTGGGVDHGAPYTINARGGSLTGRGPTTPFAIDANLIDGGVKTAILGSTQKPFDFRDFDLFIRSEGPNLADLGYLFGVEIPNTPAFILAAHATHNNHVTRFRQISGRFGASTIQGDFTSDHSRPRRMLTADLRAELLRAKDLATLLAPRPSHAVTRLQPGVAAIPSNDEQRPFDLAGLQNLDARLDLRAAKVTGYPAPLSDVRLHLGMQDGHLDIHPLSATSSHGRIEVALSAHGEAGGLALRVDAVAHDLQIDPWSASKSPRGVFDGAAHLSGSGRSQKDLLAHAQGEMGFRLRDGEIKRSQADALAGDPVRGAWAALTDTSRHCEAGVRQRPVRSAEWPAHAQRPSHRHTAG